MIQVGANNGSQETMMINGDRQEKDQTKLGIKPFLQMVTTGYNKDTQVLIGMIRT